MSSENDYDYYHEEGFWRNPNIHRAMMSEKIEQLRYALTCAMTRIYQAKSMGVDVTDARFEQMVDKALNMEEDYD